MPTRSDPLIRRSRAALAGLVLSCVAVAPARATAQAAAGAVRVHLTTADGAPLADAEVAIVRGLLDVVAAGRTDAAGARVLAATLPPGDYHLVARKLGFARVERFFAWTGRDTLRLELQTAPVAQTLGTVRVEASQDLRRRKLFIDAEAIAASKRTLVDASDIVTRLRPDMIHGLGGPRQHCLPLVNVWVNGTRVRLVTIDPAVQAEKRMARRAMASSPHLYPQGRTAMGAAVLTVLGRIRPEHVAEIVAHDCGDLSLQRANAESAIFITLKPGVAFEPDRGSFVTSEEALLARAGLTASPASAAAESAAPEVLPAYRFRVLGVYDQESGAPVAGVDVVDVRTGWKATTGATGAATLAFLPEGGGTVRLVRAGYRAQEVPVVISPADTVPITLLLERVR